MWARHKYTFFSIIELLVVIAIISILASLLMPALSRAKEKAYALQCQNNLKQAGTIAHVYSHDWNGAIAPTWRLNAAYPGSVTSTASGSNDPLSPYHFREITQLHPSKIFMTCPSWHSPDTAYNSFGQNRFIAYAFHSTAKYWKYVKLTHPSDLVFWGPSTSIGMSKPNITSSEGSRGHWPHMRSYYYYPNADRRYPRNGAANYLFIDNHVSSVWWHADYREGNWDPDSDDIGDMK